MSSTEPCSRPAAPDNIDMKKTALAFSLAACLAASAGAARAQTYEVVQPIETRPLRFVVGAGLTHGGDKLATAYYEDGDEIELRAGDTIALLAGVDYRFSPQFSVQGTVGYHLDSAPARNGDMRFVRVPLELLGYYHVNDKLRAGGGIRFVTNTEFRSSGASDIGDYRFEDSASAVAELEYMVARQVGVKLRYVNDRFEEKRFGGKVKGDHVGLLANFYF